MKGLIINLKRREFLEWITVVGISSAIGQSFNLPKGKEGVVKGIPDGEEQDLRTQADKITFHVFQTFPIFRLQNNGRSNCRNRF